MTRHDSSGGQGGFSLIELLIVVALIGIIANIAIPMVWNALVKAQAVRALGDTDAIFKAANQHHIESGDFPRTRGWGRLPPEFSERLAGMAFTRSDLDYRWVRNARRHGVQIRANDDDAIIDLIREQWNGSSVRNRSRLFLYEDNER